MLTELKKLLGLVGGEPLDPASKEELMQEAYLLILSQATLADTNISACEVETVQRIIKKRIGVEVSSADIRITAISDHFETHKFDAFVSRLGNVLDESDRIELAGALAEVIESDGRESPFETEFFSNITTRLNIDPSALER